MNESDQLVAGGFQFTPFAIQPNILLARDEALAESALIGKVENGPQNEKCVAARKKIRGLLSLFETSRKKLKEPILEAGRQLDRTVEKEVQELKVEDGRLENLEREFIRAELRRKQEEEELQRREIARIEAEKQAELRRIEAEKQEAERKAREAQEAAAKLASEASNEKEREAAEKARIEAEKLASEAKNKADAEAARVTDVANNAAVVESKPVEISRAKGQTVRKEWIIDSISEFQLLRARPDLVTKVQFDMVQLKQDLASGMKIPGVVAHEDLAIGSRGTRPSLIEV